MDSKWLIPRGRIREQRVIAAIEAELVQRTGPEIVKTAVPAAGRVAPQWTKVQYDISVGCGDPRSQRAVADGDVNPVPVWGPHTKIDRVSFDDRAQCATGGLN